MSIIKLNHISKIEGHANLTVKIEEGQLKKVELAVVEGARFFEGFIKGRSYKDVHLLVQRICGICSVSHTIAALNAIENALGVEVSQQTKDLRELMEIGAIIQSHSLHVYLLALPDYLGYISALDMTAKYKNEVLRGLGLKKLGNDIDKLIGGRIMHPVASCVGGFSSLPSQEELDELQKKLEKSRIDASKTADLFASLNYRKFKRPTEYICLREDDKYAITGGDLMFSNGFEVPKDKYLSHLKETVMPYSNAKFSTFEKRSFYVGALARVNNNIDFLSKNAQKSLQKNSITFPSYNPYHNNYAQAIEIVHVIDRAIEILSNLKIQDEEPVEVKPKAARGVAIIEAPRGILIHDYTLDAKGNVKKANVVTPTAQNLKNIEDDIYKLLPKMLDEKEEVLINEMEKLIRSYDPCISCSAHFLKVKWIRN
jgi:sulfhydrogenase subunit alpha